MPLPAIATIGFGYKNGHCEESPTKVFFDDALLGHTAAIEEFRPFVSKGDRAKYQQAWQEYKNAISANDALGDAKLRWDSGMVITDDGNRTTEFLPFIEQKIKNILHFSAPKMYFLSWLN